MAEELRTDMPGGGRVVWRNSQGLPYLDGTIRLVRRERVRF